MQPNLSITDLRALPIPSPPTTSEQARIEANLQAVLSESKLLETIYSPKLANLDELKQSLLQKAFSGQLTARTPKKARV